MRDLLAGNDTSIRFSPGTYRTRNVQVGKDSGLAFGGGDYHFLNLVTKGGVDSYFTDAQSPTLLLIGNKVRIGDNNGFNVAWAEAPATTPVDPLLVRIYVHGQDGPSPLDFQGGRHRHRQLTAAALGRRSGPRLEVLGQRVCDGRRRRRRRDDRRWARG